MAGNRPKGELSQGNLYLCRNQILKQKRTKTQALLSSVCWAVRVCCPLIVSEITILGLLPTLKTCKADLRVMNLHFPYSHTELALSQEMGWPRPDLGIKL